MSCMVQELCNTGVLVDKEGWMTGEEAMQQEGGGGGGYSHRHRGGGNQPQSSFAVHSNSW